jgi:aminoglycoside phosphotransferase (APT) family kinase protein
MISDALNIDLNLVRRLIASQFPSWSDLPITEVLPNGWDNRTFRLGDRMSIRLPSAERYAAQVDREHRWLPVLSDKLPLPIPTPLAIGKPDDSYPYKWSIYGWIDGDTAIPERIDNMPMFASALSEFLVALRSVDTSGAPGPGAGYRGGDLGIYNDQTRRAIEMMGAESNLDRELLTDIWDTALASKWNKPPVWIHGDVSSGNILVKDGTISAVIDFGSTAVGDPACDLSIAWTMFDEKSRDTFRNGMDLDEMTWTRGKGWTLWKALIILSGISETNTVEGERSRQTVDRILNDHI